MRSYRGVASGNWSPFVGQVTFKHTLFGRKGKILVSTQGNFLPLGYRGLITNNDFYLTLSRIPTVKFENLPKDLGEGDCVIMAPDGSLTIVWHRHSQTNTLLLTEKCNCRCLMCPQPPKTHDEWLLNIARETVNLIDPQDTKTICVTGGEPTLLGEKFLEIVSLISSRLPNVDFILLTNGKTFSDYQFAKEYAAVASQRTLTCVSLHSDIEKIHDEIVGVGGSFSKTIQGLYNLARLRMRTEIRHVVNLKNASRLEGFARFTYRNFPFVCHVALMGMEMTGLAIENHNKVWIDPADYSYKLDGAAWCLHQADFNVSIYNIPLCLLPSRSWIFARQSISEWKNTYVPCCEGCYVKTRCAGFFTTSGNWLSSHIRPIAALIEIQNSN